LSRTQAPLTVSVVIPSYNEHGRLAELLASLALQRYPRESLELIVVDDASARPVPAATLRLAHPVSVRIIRHPANRGRAQARNTALEAAQGDLVIFLDSDMTASPDFVQAHAEAHANTHQRVVIGNIQYAPELGTDALMRYQDSRGVHCLRPGDRVSYKCFVTGNSSVRRSFLATAGAFDPAFTRYGGEDLELGYRLHQLGAQFHYAEAAHTFHHHRRGLGQVCAMMETYGEHSLVYLLAKHPQLDHLLRVAFLGTPWHPKSALLRLALTDAVYRPVLWLGVALTRWWLPDVFLSYLFWSSRTRGYSRIHRRGAPQ
jgi:glycosyltransferase involved in cell wall biosynthesis